MNYPGTVHSSIVIEKFLLWKIRKNKDGTYRIKNVYSGKVASVQNDSSYAGAKLSRQSGITAIARNGIIKCLTTPK